MSLNDLKQEDALNMLSEMDLYDINTDKIVKVKDLKL